MPSISSAESQENITARHAIKDRWEQFIGKPNLKPIGQDNHRGSCPRCSPNKHFTHVVNQSQNITCNKITQ